MMDIEKDRRELREWTIQCRQICSKFEQAQLKIPRQTNTDEKIINLQNNNKKISENISKIVSHLQDNYLTKE